MKLRRQRTHLFIVGILVGTLLCNGLTVAQTPVAKVKTYTVSPTLREVVNLRVFSKAAPLTISQKRMLAQNLFVVAPTDAKQLFHIYEENDYHDMPSFITSDAILHLYHIFYDFTLRSVEENALTPVLHRLTEGMLVDSIKTWEDANDPQLKEAALKNVVYFAVAARLLGLEGKVMYVAGEMLQTELSLIEHHEGFKVGAIFPYPVDYSQFVPRGHYTRSDTLQRFFRAMMWYGLTPFALRTSEGRRDEQIRQGLLLTRSLYKANLDKDWATIYEPTSFFVGAVDDITPAEWKAEMDKVYGENASLTDLADARKFEAFADAAGKLRTARIQMRIMIQPGKPKPPDPAIQLRFMGQRYIPDSEILQRLSIPILRVFPSGLDVMAVMGSERARDILDSNSAIYNPKNWAEYGPERAKLTEQFAREKKETWTSNLYWSWLYTLKALLEPAPAGYPSFMRNAAWQDKSLFTALGSWAELRHDTILYGKQSGAEMGDGGEPAPYKGYVEPNVLFWGRLLSLTKQSHEGLASRKLLSDELKERFEQFEDLLATLKQISEKELRNQKLTEDEYDVIRHIGGQLEYMTLSVMTGNPDTWEMVNETDRDMAVVADVHTGGDKVLEEGVGHAYEILVIVPVEGKLVLTRGASFSYDEFQQPIGDRLTDEKWQGMVNNGRAPALPVWTKTFVLPGKPRRIKPT